MKNIKYLALLVFSITLLVSCGQDDVDSVTNPGTLNPTSEINLGFIDDKDGQLVLESADDNATTLTIGLSYVCNACQIHHSLSAAHHRQWPFLSQKHRQHG